MTVTVDPCCPQSWLVRPSPAKMSGMGPRDLDRLARIAKTRREELGIPLTDASAAEAGISRGTWVRLEKGHPVRDTNYAKIDKTLGWAAGSCIAIAEGGDPIPIEPESDNGVIASVPHHDLVDRARQAVVNASLLTLPGVPAGEIRSLSDQVVEELRKQGILPDAP